MIQKPAVLVVDDEEDITFPIATFLEAHGYQVTAINDGAEAIRLVSAGGFPLILADLYIDRITGMDILQAAKSAPWPSAVILMTAKGSIRTTVQADAGGAFDYIPKPVDLPSLLQVLQRAELSCKPGKVRKDEPLARDEITGTTPVMVRLYKEIARAAHSDSTVLIRGETGSGKELVARAIHQAGPRAQCPFVPLDCTAIPETLWESELFGSTRGAFTSAERDRAGIVEQARDGTVFLDEIGEIPISFQAKLLRLIEAREYRPVGASSARAMKARILAATHRDLEGMVQSGSFRADLYHRLNVLQVEVPALRDRPEDIRHLAERFLADANARHRRCAEFQPGAIRALENYAWPGNVRELKNAVERMVAMSSPGPLGPDEVHRALALHSEDTGRPWKEQSLDEAEREHVVETLRVCGGNRAQAAQRLKIQRRTLYKMLERWGILQKGHADVPKTHPSDP